ncbi:MAG: ABC transporter permease subunit [Tepidisphaeraceae bacterium]
MPIISTIEGKSFRGRVLHAAMFVALTIGAITMVYPFAIMVSGSLRSELDEADLDLVPSFLVNHETLYRKFLENKYNEDVFALNRAHAKHAFSFQTASAPSAARTREAAFEQFLRENSPPQHWRVLGGIFSNKALPSRLRQLQQQLAADHGYSLERFSHAMGSPVRQWTMIRFPAPNWLSSRYEFGADPLHVELARLADITPLAEQQLVNLTGYFLETVVSPAYGQIDTGAYNKAHTRPLPAFEAFVLPGNVPGEVDPVLRKEWVEFVRGDLNPSFVLLNDSPHAAYLGFLQARYVEISELNRTWASAHSDFSAVRLPHGQWLRGMERQDYLEFLRTRPPETYQLVGPEFAWRGWLKRKYETVQRVNEALGAEYADLDHIPMPVEAQEYAYVVENAPALRWDFATSNYHFVVSELFFQGNGFRNTMIFCALAVLAAVSVNSLAAYAMSRFRLRGTYNVLLILMATVAFPPMVTLIPKFIMLRNVDLLNTFAALVLPFAANGYLIFLLKSFFDSLPRELYEAAEIDGASEARIFWQITMTLSKPILAVVALEAFNAAYTMFLYALIVCPSEEMWLQTVWLSQFQARASSSAVFAAIVLMCIPTLLIFIFAQRLIMRGIIVPTEK